MDRHILSLKQKAAIKHIVVLWKLVDKKPSRTDYWYPSYVQMTSTLKRLRKIIKSSNLPTPLKEYILYPINEYEMLEKHSYDFYYDFVDHPSEHLEPFMCQVERKKIKAYQLQQKAKKSVKAVKA